MKEKRRKLWTTLVTVMFCASGCGRQAAPEKTEAAPVAKKELVPLTNMVFIKAGSFVRGKFKVTLTHDYWLGKFEVTQAEFAAVMGKNPSHFTNEANSAKLPVEKVKFTDAEAFCAAITKRETDAGRLPAGFVYRLPTEAEWEYACRAGTTNFFSFGDIAELADQFAWTLENSDATTHPVGEKKPNPWGLYDVHGNVWEWCSDWFEPFPAKDLEDPVGPAQSKFKVFKGGSWNYAVEFARTANRFMMAPDMGIHFVGFRVALGSPTPSPAPAGAPPAEPAPAKSPSTSTN